jgi:hypothetical protein
MQGRGNALSLPLLFEQTGGSPMLLVSRCAARRSVGVHFFHPGLSALVASCVILAACGGGGQGNQLTLTISPSGSQTIRSRGDHREPGTAGKRVVWSHSDQERWIRAARR